MTGFFRARRARLLGLAAVAGMATLGGCDRSGPAADGDNGAQANAVEPAPPPAVPAPLAPLDRAQLLAMARAAADAVAAGAPAPAGARDLVGRGFEIRLPFGCDGAEPDPPVHWGGWTYDAGRKALRLSVRSPVTQALPWVADIAGGMAYDSVEGFWIERPWTRSQECPPDASPFAAAPADEAAPPAARETLAIAQFFAPDAPRTLQRGGRPYTITLKAESPPDGQSRGYRLVLAGRLAAFGDGLPIHCRADAAAAPPLCVFAAEFRRVAIEDPADGRVLTEWAR
jgi:hypothetical protein